jgi:hypothetical protein
MPQLPDAIPGRLGDIEWEVRPEWLAGRYWWRVYVAGHPKVLVRYAENAAAAAEALAADERQFRRDASIAE